MSVISSSRWFKNFRFSRTVSAMYLKSVICMLFAVYVSFVFTQEVENVSSFDQSNASVTIDKNNTTNSLAFGDHLSTTADVTVTTNTVYETTDNLLEFEDDRLVTANQSSLNTSSSLPITGNSLVTANQSSLFTKSLLKVESNSSVTEDQSTLITNLSNTTQKKWITEIFDEAKLNFDMHAYVNPKCRRDYEIYKRHLLNQTVWAVRMKESSEWPAVGILAGSPVHLGDYPECLKSRGPGVKPKYCIVTGYFQRRRAPVVTYNAIASSNSIWLDWPKENVSAWDVIDEYETDRMRLSRRVISWAMCIPSTCKPGELRLSVMKTMKPILKANDVYGVYLVVPNLCRVKRLRQYPLGYYLVRTLLLVLAFLVSSATIYENVTQKSEDRVKERRKIDWRVELFKCFSAKRSCRILTRSSKNVFPILYFFKTCFIFGVILGHEFMFLTGLPRAHVEVGEMSYRPWTLEVLYSTLLNGFIMISGFLTFYFGIPPARKLGITWVILSIVCRWLRLVPVLGIMILIWTFILPYTGDGPFWEVAFVRQVQQCKENWWTNMLAINNFVNNFEELCMGHSWYISVDFQLTVVGCLIVFLLSINKKIGALVMLLVFVGTFVASLLRVYKNKIYGITIVFPNVIEGINSLEHVRKVYPMMYFWAPTYLVGCAAALLTLVMQSKNYKLSSLQKTMWLLSVFTIGFGVHCYTFAFYQMGRPFYALEQAVYGNLRQLSFAIPLASLLCVYFTSGLGIFNSLFELKMYVPLGRLVYCIYLISLQIQMFHTVMMTKPLNILNRTDAYWRAVTGIVYSVILAFFIFLISEGPFGSILSLLRPWSLKILLKLLGTFPHKEKVVFSMKSRETRF